MQVNNCGLVSVCNLIYSCSFSQSMESQSYDESLLRLWRTVAGMERFTADEDDDIDVSY